MRPPRHWFFDGLVPVVIALLCLLSVTVIWYFMTSLPFNDGSKIRNATLFGQYGDFIGGLLGTIFTLASFIILYVGYHQQRRQFYKAFRQQDQAQRMETFEKRFFEMVQIHRANVSEMEYTSYPRGIIHPMNTEQDRETAVHRKVFRVIYDDLELLEEETRDLFRGVSVEQIYNPKYLQEIKSNETYTTRKIDLLVLAKYDILYLIVFFGIGRSGQAIAIHFLSSRYEKAFFQPILNFVSLKPKKESDYYKLWNDIMQSPDEDKAQVLDYFRNRRGFDLRVDFPKASGLPYSEPYVKRFYYSNDYNKYYGGHQFRLGHYFRHLYQAVRYVNDAGLEGDEAYNYIKFLRAQLSTFEQIILAINSLSALGRAWELENKQKKAMPVDQMLISKYNMIRNIPTVQLFEDLDISQYYDFVDYEVKYDDQIEVKRKQYKWFN